MNLRQRRRWVSKIKRVSRIGKRCPEYWPDCIICRSWRFFDEHGRFPQYEEVIEQDGGAA